MKRFLLITLSLQGAHCVFNVSERDLKCRAGEWDTQTTKERLPYQERNVQAMVVHPEFNSKTLFNDIVSYEKGSKPIK